MDVYAGQGISLRRPSYYDLPSEEPTPFSQARQSPVALMHSSPGIVSNNPSVHTHAASCGIVTLMSCHVLWKHHERIRQGPARRGAANF